MPFTTTFSSLSTNGWQGGQAILQSDFVKGANSANISSTYSSRMAFASSTSDSAIFGDTGFDGTYTNEGAVANAPLTFPSSFGTITQQDTGNATNQNLGETLQSSGNGVYAIAGTGGFSGTTPVGSDFARIYYNNSLQTTINPNATNLSTFGNSTMINENGDIVAVRGQIDAPATQFRVVELHSRTGVGTWTYEDTLTEPQFNSGYGDSDAIDFNSAGDVIAIGARLYDGTYTDEGAVYIYEKSVGVWSLSATITLTDAFNRDDWEFGRGVKLNSTGDSLIVGFNAGTLADPASPPGVLNGEFRKFKKQSGTWNQVSSFSPTDILTVQTVTFDGIGLAFDASKDNHSVVVLSATVPSGGALGRGRIYVAQESQGLFVQTQEITNGNFLSYPIRISTNGKNMILQDDPPGTDIYFTLYSSS